ncbi:hypothetical protein BGZ76_008591 [Entomortierella beljakovae]|nr:hypothetical protein BGZ76_008591 [Entomortierella beljakovae]
MVDALTTISESASPHGLRKTNGPYLTCSVIINDGTDTQADTFSYIKPSASSGALGSRCRSFSFSNNSLNLYSSSVDTVNKSPKEIPANRVSKLVAAFSNPSLYQGSTASLAVPPLRGDRPLPRFCRSQSMVIDSHMSESTSHTKLKTLSEAPNSHGNLSSINHDAKGWSPTLREESVTCENSASMSMSKSQPALLQVQIGPIARKNFREHSIENDEAILRASQLFVPDKSWVRATQGISGDVPVLDLDPFSPYSPGFHNLNSNTLDTTDKNPTQNEPVNLNEYCKRVNILPKEEEEEESDDEEITEGEEIEEIEEGEEREEREEREEGEEERKDIYLDEAQQDSVIHQSQAWFEDFDNNRESVEGHGTQYDDHISIEYKDELAEELKKLKVEEEDEEEVEDEEEEEEEEEEKEEVNGIDVAGLEHAQEPGNSAKVVRETTLSSYEIDFALETSTWELIYRHGEDPIDASTPAITSTRVTNSSDSTRNKNNSEPQLTTEIDNGSMVSPYAVASMKELSTESEAIANRWRRDQSAEFLVQCPSNSTVEHPVRRDPFIGSQLLEERHVKRINQQKFNSTGTLPGTRKLTGDDTSYPQLTRPTIRFKSQSGNLETTFEGRTSMSDDEASSPAPSISTEMSNDISSLESPTSSEDSASSVECQEKRPAKIDTNFPRLVLNSRHQRSESPTDKEQVVASKVWRSGKLFAKKIKTIAVFEYNTAKKLGKGNFGIVYQGKKINENVEVAIKKITRKLPGEIEKLGLVQREMKVCRLFNNKTGIVPLLDIITTNKHHYLVFEKAEGDLAEMLRVRCKDAIGRRSSMDLNKQPMSPSCSLGNIFNINEIRTIMYTVVVGAQALHKEGYSHKDIKPANILYSRGCGLLCDFGLCSQNEELPQNQFFGTQDYASPEARRVGYNRGCDYIQSDVYSLGAVLYELATGSVLSKVISQGLNWQRIANFGGGDFSNLLQGMVNDIEKRWSIDQVVNSPFWTDSAAG